MNWSDAPAGARLVAVRPYAQYCPISRAAELVGDRWSVVLIREMFSGSRRFNELARGLPGISRALLSKRLQQLERGGLLVRQDGGYDLTDAGRQLEPVLVGLAEWGARWAFGEPQPDELNPDLLVWWMRAGVDRDRLGQPRSVVEVVFRDRRKRYWLVVEADDVSVCLRDPGFEVDVVLEAELATLYEVWNGRIALVDTLADGRLRASGRPALVRSVPSWLLLSPVAGLVHQVTTEGASAGS